MKRFLLSILWLVPVLCVANTEHIPSREDCEQRLADPSRWEQVWADEFEGDTIDSNRWSLINGGGGFGNNELQHYTPRTTNALVREGCLVIRALKEAYRAHRYTSAKLHTGGKASWTYGKFEIRARLPRGQGIWPAIWMMPEDHHAHGGWPVCGEIDIMELVGNAPGTVHGTLHYGDPWRNTGGGFTLPSGRTFADDFHTFTMEWTPGVFRWYVDGALFHTETRWYTSEPEAMWPAPFSKPFYLQMNLAVGGNWPGAPDATTVLPQQMQVDYVRVYRFLGTYPEVEHRSAAWSALPTREPMPDGNLVYNGSFEDGDLHWDLQRQEGGEAVMTVKDEQLAVNRKAPGRQTWSIQMMQGLLPLEKHARYAVTFRAHAEKPTDIEVNVGKASQHWDSYSGKRTVRLGENPKTFRFDFRMWAHKDPEARLEFNLGKADTATVCLDDVRVELLEEGTPQVLDEVLHLEAEAYDASSGVNTEACVEGGLDVGWWHPGDWVAYPLDVARAGRYRIDIRYAAMEEGARLGLQAGSAEPVSCELPRTGDWQGWKTAATEMDLSAGPQEIRLRCTAPGFNLNWIRLNRVPTSP